jgi:hypothetical protein
MSEVLQHISEKLDRADKHITELHGECETFLNAAPNRELIDYDAESAEAFKEFHRKRLVPVRFAVIASDAIHQIRTCLDHLANGLIVKDGGTPTDWSQFPICSWKPDPTKPKQVERYERQIRGITRAPVRTLIDNLQPYTRGDERHLHWLAILKKLNDSDKHRALRLHTVVVQPRITRTEVFLDGDFQVESDRIDDGTQETVGYADPDGDWVDVVNVQRRLTPFVAFADWPGIPSEDIEVASGLWSFWRGVTKVVKEFSPFLTP